MISSIIASPLLPAAVAAVCSDHLLCRPLCRCCAATSCGLLLAQSFVALAKLPAAIALLPVEWSLVAHNLLQWRKNPIQEVSHRRSHTDFRKIQNLKIQAKQTRPALLYCIQRSALDINLRRGETAYHVERFQNSSINRVHAQEHEGRRCNEGQSSFCRIIQW